LALIKIQNGVRTLHVINADGTNDRTLTDNLWELSALTWSPDGTRIAFGRVVDNQQEVFVIHADGTGLTRLTNSPGLDEDAVWSPDSARLAFVSFRENDRGGIYMMNSDGTDQIRIIQSPGQDADPVWAPDGRYLIFLSNREGHTEIYLTEARKDALVYRLTNSPLSKRNISWRPH
jgi:TolB protein